MDLNTFLHNIAEQFENTDPAEIIPSANFKGLKEWSSLTALSVMAMVDEEFDVSIKGDDIRNSLTIQDIYNIVKSKL